MRASIRSRGYALRVARWSVVRRQIPPYGSRLIRIILAILVGPKPCSPTPQIVPAKTFVVLRSGSRRLTRVESRVSRPCRGLLHRKHPRPPPESMCGKVSQIFIGLAAIDRPAASPGQLTSQAARRLR